MNGMRPCRSARPGEGDRKRYCGGDRGDDGSPRDRQHRYDAHCRESGAVLVRPARLPGLPGVALGGARLPWHPAAVLALPAEDGRLWPGGKRAGWNRGYDLATGAPLNRAARDGEIRRRLAAGESVRAVTRALRCGLATVQRARSAA